MALRLVKSGSMNRSESRVTKVSRVPRVEDSAFSTVYLKKQTACGKTTTLVTLAHLSEVT